MLGFLEVLDASAAAVSGLHCGGPCSEAGKLLRIDHLPSRETVMPIRSTRMHSALAFIGALLGLASWAAARKLVARKGDPIPFRIALPEEAEIVSRPGVLST